jgi:hypothetical protein
MRWQGAPAPLSAASEERGAQRSVGGVSPRRAFIAGRQGTCPVIAPLDHPLFRKRERGFFFFLNL